MFNVDMYLQKLRAMDPCDVAEMVRDALDTAGVKYTDKKTGILFDGLLEADEPSVVCETSFVESQLIGNCKIYSYIDAKRITSCTFLVESAYTSKSFDATDYTLAA